MKKKKFEKAFLPVSKDEMVERGWYYYDFLVVTADAYIDHPSFGTAIIARVLEAEGYRVAVLAQPDWHSADAFREMGRPRDAQGAAAKEKHYVGHLRMDRLFHQRSAADPI